MVATIKNMIQDDVIKALQGLDETGLAEVGQKLSEAGRKSLAEAVALRKERTSVQEATDAEKSKLEAIKKELQETADKLDSTKKATSQFRDEQIGKAKTKFFNDFKISPEKQAEYEATFKGLDSGKVDSDLIYKDFIRAHGAINADTLLGSDKTLEDQKEQARLAAIAAAGRSEGAPPGKEPKKFSDEAENLAKNAGISPEAAEKQIKGGMKRVHEI